MPWWHKNPASNAATGRLRIALFTPLPPSRTGTADYAQSLLGSLVTMADVTVFSDPPRSFQPLDFDFVVYELANNPHHASIYNLALRHPGIVVLHEANLHSLIKGLTLQTSNPENYQREVCYEIFGSEIRADGMSQLGLGEAQANEFLMIRRVLEASNGCIVHNRHAESIVRRKGFAKPVQVIPHGANPRTMDRVRCKTELKLDPDTFTIGLFGYFRPAKRIGQSVKVIEKVCRQLPHARILVVGEEHAEASVRAELEKYGLLDKAKIFPFFECVEKFDCALSACDVILNLSLLSFGETSGITMRSLALGLPVVVPESGANLDLPDEICFKIPPDSLEVDLAANCVAWIAGHPLEAQEIGSAAQEWIRGNCSWDRTARRYVEFLPSTKCDSKSANTLAEEISTFEILQQWSQPGTEQETYLSAHANRLEKTLDLIPQGGVTSAILELGCYLQITPALQTLRGYGEVRGGYLGACGVVDERMVHSRTGDVFRCPIDLFDAEKDRFPFEDGRFNTVVCGEMLEHLQTDPMHMMAELNRVLKQDGALVLSTPNAVSFRAMENVMHGNHPAFYNCYSLPDQAAVNPRHAREYTPTEIVLLLQNAGFIADKLQTIHYGEAPPEPGDSTKRNCSRNGFPEELRRECILVLARKVSPPNSRFPSWLYQL